MPSRLKDLLTGIRAAFVRMACGYLSEVSDLLRELSVHTLDVLHDLLAHLVGLLLTRPVFGDFLEDLAGTLQYGDHVFLDLIQLLDSSHGRRTHFDPGKDYYTSFSIP